jgi:hypothetical protein
MYMICACKLPKKVLQRLDIFDQDFFNKKIVRKINTGLLNEFYLSPERSRIEA